MVSGVSPLALCVECLLCLEDADHVITGEPDGGAIRILLNEVEVFLTEEKSGERLWMGSREFGVLGCFLVLKLEDAVTHREAVVAGARRKSWVSSALWEEARQVASLRSVTDSPLA